MTVTLAEEDLMKIIHCAMFMHSWIPLSDMPATVIASVSEENMRKLLEWQEQQP